MVTVLSLVIQDFKVQVPVTKAPLSHQKNITEYKTDILYSLLRWKYKKWKC